MTYGEVVRLGMPCEKQWVEGAQRSVRWSEGNQRDGGYGKRQWQKEVHDGEKDR